MAELTTDDEKVEAIKKWWKENGTAVVAGILIGLVAVFGWRAWVNHQDQVGQNASLAFEQLMMATGSGQHDSAIKQAENLVNQHAGTPYAALADLALAKVRVEQDDLDGAAKALRSAVERAKDPSLATLAALRLARVLIASNALDDALAVIEQQDQGTAFSADFAGLRGDIAVAKGQTAEARAAYEAAIAGNAGLSRLIELKLQDLPAAPRSAS
ncbi:MAG: tetratricopeptide repeat protein [Lamprobacter sp.]|uniref:YfgM family protein n=1 Tax=Lamprobacter sp. TaxID=3100796 RepID=UPI002B25AA63|nr:tetratricopeptide repeat protein [Lamprobacter sp.]MEA3638920.1 tetratricopeptide repeat protein [Lamprobacter sp.]